MEVGSVSVIPVPAAPDAPESVATATPALRLVTGGAPAHDHVWELRSVEYDETFEVRCYECTDCDDVMYR
jgi:hypothetical protein